MAKLVKRSQQVLSLKETIEKVNQDLLFLTEQLKEIAVKGDAGELTREEVRSQLVQIQTRFESLKEQKEALILKYKQLQYDEKRKQDIKDNGLIEFYNLVLSYRIPRKEDQSPVYLKIYEVVQTFVHRSVDSADVRNWVVSLSGVSPSDSENYFSSKKPLQRMQNVHISSGEVSYHSIAKEAAGIIEDYAQSLKLATQSISLHQQLPPFSNKEFTVVKKEVEKAISDIASKEEEKEQEELETKVEPALEEKPEENRFKNQVPDRPFRITDV